MKTDLKEILAGLPDFDEMTKLAALIREASVRKLMTEKDIKKAEADIVRKVSTDPNFFTNGKAPAMSFVEATYRYTGIDGELLPLREQYIIAVGDLDELKLTMEIYKQMYDVWRTLSANERNLSL